MTLQTNKNPSLAKKERNSNIELLRIIAMLFVIILHYNNKSNGKAFAFTEALPQHYQLLVCFEIMAICAVNIFIMITGYFSCSSKKADVTKVLRLYADVSLLSVSRYLLWCISGSTVFSFSKFLYYMLPMSWYVAVYSALYLISPYLNIIIQRLSAKQFRTMLLVGMIVFSIWPSSMELFTALTGIKSTSMCPISTQGSGAGYTIVNFVLMYLIGAYLRLHSCENSNRKSIPRALVSYMLCTILLILYSRIYFSGALSYCNPLVIGQAVSLFKIFQHMKIKSRVINEIAGCCFGVFLMHSNFFKRFQIERFVTGNILLIPIHLILTAFFIFSICAVIYWVYQHTVGILLNKWLKRLHFQYEVG